MQSFNALRAWWEDFWFRPVPALNLGVCRVLFFSAFFLFYLGVDFSAWGGVGEVFWMPAAPFSVFSEPPLSERTLGILEWVWKGALLTSAFGLATRVSTTTAFVLGFFLIGLPHQFGKLHHNDALVVIVMGIMALSRCGDAFSLDRLLARRRQPAPGATATTPRSGEYRWPVRAVWLALSAVFFSAGLIKAYPNGFEYVMSDTMAYYLSRQFLGMSSVDPLVDWGAVIASSTLASRGLAFATVAVEFAFPLVLFSRWARRLIVPAALIGQVMIRVIMGPPFTQFWICYLFFVPWDRVLAAASTFLEKHAGVSLVRGAPARGAPARSASKTTASS